MNLISGSFILILSSVCLAEPNYTEAQNKLAEGIYIASGIQQNINNYGKYLESQVNKEYKPVIGWTFSALDVIVKQRIEFKMRFK